MNPHQQNRILVVGGTGYIGGRLIPRLLDAGYQVRALVRSPAKLASRPWSRHPHLQVVRADLQDSEGLAEAIRDCTVAYYLAHSMVSAGSSFARADRTAAANMARAAESVGMERIIFLGGLGEEGGDLSPHLRSRRETAAILRQGRVPVTVLRAAMIIGSGSASFEILRYLVERLPVMITPRWLDTPCQPIGVRNVLEYLTGLLDHPETAGETYDIGQEQIVTYRELMETFTEEAGLPPRWIIPVPLLTPRLSSYWIHLVTPIPASLARPLAEGLRNPVICRDERIKRLIPIDLLDCRQAIRRAIARVREQQVVSAWSDSGPLPPAEWHMGGDPAWAGGTVLCDDRSILIAAQPEEVWRAISRIGGEHGWYFADWLWWVRGAIDRMLGGVGISRGRRRSDDLQVGDVLDFWRVLVAEPRRRVTLVAEMKLPGEAILEFSLHERNDGVELVQRARFLPRGLGGLIYWWLVSPFHGYVFSGMLQGIAEASGGRVISGPGPVNQLSPDGGK